ncbi:ubiquitin carboxyl-terminal hydrolase 3-like [Uranotaenia lowii]|uniref:ubiquitin carboxyl-terminal hydrolase 3-like n=1 Tax=Uranotaenia lowii TaxID=190385 RepID=UPI00247B16BE|nr:ubiquitin carboxyl-terminal hydrolase 3-like [Uranotaenia lowii]
MDCPHIGDNVVLRKEAVKSIKQNLCGGSLVTTPDSAGTLPVAASSPTSFAKLWKCSECSGKDNWLCLQCGSVLCGRYESAHALKHSSKQNHNICINTVNLSVYCYKCDEFVVNDTADNMIDEIRQELKDGDADSVSETSSTMEEISSSKSTPESASGSTTSSDSGWEEPTTPTTTTSGAGSSVVFGSAAGSASRKLRPRKRTISSDSNNENGQNGKRKSAAGRRVVGLRNLGNTCFMNSVLQSLSNIQEFSTYFNAMPSLDTQKGKQKAYHSRSMKENLDDVFVVEELRKVLLNLSQGGDGSKGAISPECLFLVIWKVVPQFRGHRQHDAHEFLRYMLDRLHMELQQVSIPVDISSSSTSSSGVGNTNSPHKSGEVVKTNPYNVHPLSHLHTKGRNSIVTNVFGGVLQSEVRCLVCGMESKKHDPFLDLSLDIPEKYYSKEPVEGIEKDKDGTPVCHISDCLASFTAVEELAETELYYCNSCKCKQKSTKRFWVRRLPNVLCLHIKRFRWNNFYRTKIDLRITFPINALDMSQYVLQNGPETRRSNSSCNIYDLAAVIVHHGNGSSCGHYTSYAINNGVWMHFNDHSVKEVSTEAVADCKPYILFYIKRDPSNVSRLGTGAGDGAPVLSSGPATVQNSSTATAS